MFKNIIIIVLVILAIILSLAVYSSWSELKEVSRQLQLAKEELALRKKLPSQELLPEDLKPGTVGEEGTSVGELPLVIPNTSGIIKEVKEDRIIVAGSGSNFADQKPRDLIVLFTNSTVTMKIGGKIRHQGLDGLEYLKPEMEILINGEENIRGKTEFRARYINII